MILLTISFSFLLGLCKMELTGKIVGGTQADIKKWPFMTFMALFDGPYVVSVCGGSLLSSQAILTAAHCLDDVFLTESRHGDPGCTVYIGADNLKTHRYQMKSVIGYLTHEKYNVERIEYDIGVAFLDTTVKFGQTVQKTVLHPSPAKGGTRAIVAGWGSPTDPVDMSNGGYSTKLLSVTQDVISLRECSFHFTKLESGTLCAGNYDPRKYAFAGDSGGPLVTIKGSYQIGIVSYRTPNATNGITVYTAVSHYYQWIKTAQGKLYRKFCSKQA